MIVKNGEILAIDHIAHDNTLSGNGTSAKPVGLSQSTKDLIDSKVKKTDFETYKSSAANQISNINTKITTDESNFESYKSSAANQINNINNKIAADEADFNSYKSSAHNEIARIDGSIAAVNAAKVDKTTFTQYQTDVANNFTAVNKRIDDVDAAKQNKGDYVSASNFESYKSSAHNEIARVDEKIDTTSDNLRDNYYKTSETYNRTEVDEKFANFGGFKFRDPDQTKDNEPKLAPGEVIDPKAIYLTQPAGATQYLQWIWNTEVTPNVWKCIGDTTMDLSDYAKTVDVVASANANKTEVKNWADAKFETKQDFESVIAGYYTKDEADDLLNTKVDKTTFEAYQQTVSNAFDSVDRDFENTSAWANNTFATKTDLNDVQTDLETEISNLSTDIESDLADVSGKIINELNDVESALDNKINNVDTKLDTVSGELVGKIKTVEETLSGDIDDVNKKVNDLKTELESEYYDADTIEDILAASGDYYDKDEIDSLLDNYVKTEDLKPINEKIESVSGEFNKYYTKTDVDNKFTTKDTFDTTIADINNDLGDIVETVSAIDQDVASLSAEIDKKFNTVIETSDTVIATPTTKPDGTISYSLSAIGGGGSQSNYLWKPTVDESGNIEWTISVTTDTPASANIKGPQGPQGIQGISGTPGKDGEDGEDGITPKLKIDENDIWNVSYDNEATWISLGVSATGPKGETGAQGPQGIQGIQGVSGTPGKDGENGITPHIGDNNHWFIDDYDTGVFATGPQGPAGTNGTNGKDGTDGKDGVSPTVTAATIEGGNRVTFTYGEGSTKYIDVMSGVPGLPGVSPTVTVTNIPADPSDPDHQNGGTEITITDATSTNKFSAWNGNDGTMAGAPDIEGKNGISAVLAGSTYEVGLSGEFYKAVTSVSAKLDASVAASTYATKNALDDYLTKNDAAEAYQPKGEYLSANALNGYATEAWVVDKHYLVANDIAGKADKTDLQYVSAGVDYVSGAIPDTSDMATKSWVGEQGYLQTIPSEYITETELSTALLGYLTKLSADDLYQPIGNYLTTVATSGSIIGTGLAANKIGLVTSAENALKDVVNKANTADVYSKTDADDKFVTTANITTQGADYVMTTTGWKVLSLPGGGMTQVIHDTTLTGQGNADDNKLGVAWSALSGNTIASALSAGSATVAANLGTSSFADITGAINAKADATAISDMLTKTVAEETYQTIAGMSDYLTTAQYATNSAKYVTSGNEISAANEQYALTTTGWTKIVTPATFTGVTVTGSISGGGVNNDTIGLLTSAENALTDVANKVAKPDTTQTELNNNYLIYSTLTGTGTTTGWMPLSANYYSKSEADGRYQKKEDMSSYLTTAQYETDSAKYVSTGDILTAANNKLTGIKIGSTSYAVPTTDLSNYYTKSETSATSELNTEFAKKLDSTIAASTYQTIDDMSAYLPLTGGTVTGQLTISGNNFNNNLDLKRGNYEGFIGLANNGAITFKNNANGSTSQIEFLTSASKTFDITVKDNSSTPQSVGKLYVMSAHSLADAAATSANWANDGMLHIILES